MCGRPLNVPWASVHYDVQLMGGIVLHQGKIAEMKTGEGKTLVSTLPVYLNSLTGQSVHIVTVNDYLAKRDGRVDGGPSTTSWGSPSVACSTNPHTYMTLPGMSAVPASSPCGRLPSTRLTPPI